MAEAFAKAVAENHGNLEDSLQSEMDKMMAANASGGPPATEEAAASDGDRDILKDDPNQKPGEAAGPSDIALKEEPKSPLAPPPLEQTEMMVECVKCGEVKDAKRCTKKSKKYICHPCNSTASQLSRAISGGFDSQAFRNLSEEDQRQFWKDAAGASKRDLMTMYSAKVIATNKKEMAEGTDCAFQPLGFWSKQGYDVKLIQERTPPDDIREHPILGTTYRIHVDVGSTRNTKGLLQEQEAHGSADHGVAQSPAEAKAKADKPVRPQDKAKAEARAVALNGKLLNTATKVIAALTPTLTSWDDKRLTKVGEEMAEEDWKIAREKYGELVDFYEAAIKVQGAYHKDQTKPIAPESVPSLQAVKSAAKSYADFMKLHKPAAKKQPSRKRKADEWMDPWLHSWTLGEIACWYYRRRNRAADSCFS